MSGKYKKTLLPALLIFWSYGASAQTSDCIIAAARCFQINPLLIKAIIWQESQNNQGSVNNNKNHTIDVGVMQINSIHFKALKLKGISEEDLRQNSCINVFSGTWILKDAVKRNGYTWQGVGNYHSGLPSYQIRYVRGLIDIIRKHPDKLVALKTEHPYSEAIGKKFQCETQN